MAKAFPFPCVSPLNLGEVDAEIILVQEEKKNQWVEICAK